MKLIDSISILAASETKRINLYHGDLTDIPENEAVDLLILSAFRGDYAPTYSSLIGALFWRGLSVADLAEDKEVDLIDTFSCWLSKDLDSLSHQFGVKRVLCFEPARSSQAAELVGDVFRALMPFALGDMNIKTIAMPILAAGDQMNDRRLMLTSVLDAAWHWLSRGLPITTLKIVIKDSDAAQQACHAFSKWKKDHSADQRAERRGRGQTSSVTSPTAYDFFVSYSHKDAIAVDHLVQAVLRELPEARVFCDRLELDPGAAWQQELDRALEYCRKVIVVYSPDYLLSKMCLEEFNMARLRHRESDGGILLPVYLRTAQLPLYMRTIHYMDCRESDLDKVTAACPGLVDSLKRLRTERAAWASTASTQYMN